MAYAPREIKDRVAVGDDIFIVEDLGDNRIRLIPAPTHISEPGTPVNKELLQHMENHLVPPGAIIMWSGAINDIPVGWALCDGTNGTPDLRDRFIVGAGGSYNVGNTGGASSVTLEVSQMPSHAHTGSTISAGSHTHDTSPYVGNSLYPNFMASSNTTIVTFEFASGGEGEGFPATINEVGTLELNMESAGSHGHSLSIASTGGSQPHENRPPYYALCFIMKL
jgi:microcystin-dependent protein